MLKVFVCVCNLFLPDLSSLIDYIQCGAGWPMWSRVPVVCGHSNPWWTRWIAPYIYIIFSSCKESHAPIHWSNRFHDNNMWWRRVTVRSSNHGIQSVIALSAATHLLSHTNSTHTSVKYRLWTWRRVWHILMTRANQTRPKCSALCRMRSSESIWGNAISPLLALTHVTQPIFPASPALCCSIYCEDINNLWPSFSLCMDEGILHMFCQWLYSTQWAQTGAIIGIKAH